MKDSEWLNQHKQTQTKTAAPKPPSKTTLPPETVTPPNLTAPPPATKISATMLAVCAIATVIGAYFYFDTQSRQADKIQAQQAAKRANATPRVRSAAEIQANDAANRAYAKKLDDEAYRKEISTDILKLNSIATRFQDVNQVASVSARITLAGPVQQMQAIRRELQTIQTHPCLAPATAALTGLISETTAAYLSFMASSSEAEIKQHLDNVKAYVPDYTKKRDACVNW